MEGVFGSVVVGGRRAKKGEREQELIRQKRFGVCDYQVCLEGSSDSGQLTTTTKHFRLLCKC